VRDSNSRPSAPKTDNLDTGNLSYTGIAELSSSFRLLPTRKNQRFRAGSGREKARRQGRALGGAGAGSWGQSKQLVVQESVRCERSRALQRFAADDCRYLLLRLVVEVLAHFASALP
jgi:hypothetical protein